MKDIYYKYFKCGSEKTVVFLHGWGMCGDCFLNIASKLDNANWMTIDLMGFGKSKLTEDYFDAYEYAYQIFLLLKRMSIGNIILVGHSFGGRLSILLSSVFDLDVRGLVLTSSAGLNRFELIKWLRVKTYKTLKCLAKHNLVNKRVLNKFGSNDYRAASGELQRVLLRVVNQDLGMWLKLINCKTKLVWDKKDTETKFWICKRLNKNIKNSSIVVFKTGEHFTAFKNPYKFAEIINNL